ncbi:MAG: hypothetical protein VX796_16580 [Pseudomonadota bacterium]|nr:hypothetical protein [Pseudomonadota bacterium]
MTVHIPDYSSWTREALKAETTNIKLNRAEKLANAKSLDDSLVRKLALYDAKYHAAYAAFLSVTKPVDFDAFARSTLSIDWHRSESDRHYAIAFGTEFIQRHDAEAMGQVRA